MEISSLQMFQTEIKLRITTKDTQDCWEQIEDIQNICIQMKNIPITIFICPTNTSSLSPYEKE